MHALARADVKGGRPDAAEQNIPSYTGLHAGLNMGRESLVSISVCLTVYRPTIQL